MRDRRVLLAGDAAHVMPPFMGEGMCSGLRDANNLAWRLDLILRGLCDEPLLDAYTLERVPHNEAITAVSIEMGRISCAVDPEVAVRRDAALRSGSVPRPNHFQAWSTAPFTPVPVAPIWSPAGWPFRARCGSRRAGGTPGRRHRSRLRVGGQGQGAERAQRLGPPVPGLDRYTDGHPGARVGGLKTSTER